jgi:glucose/arabinose dehydrogenase
VPRLRRLALLLAASGTVAACASSSGNPAWQGAPANNSEQNPVQITPVVPVPAGGGGGGGGSSAPRGGSSPAPRGTEDRNVVAKHLVAPVGLTLLPDGSALVGERTTGKILDVQPFPDQPTPVVKRLTGLDASGDGGLLDLALSPHYLEDNLIYAYITTATDNRVVDFTLSGPVTPVLTGIPKGRTGNAGRIAFGANGGLYVGTGDADRPSLAADPASLAGKVLRITDIGDPAPGNPRPTSPVFTRGHHGVDGVCTVADTGQMFEVESHADLVGEVNVLAPGSYYGWPRATASSKAPLALLPNTALSPGGCAIANQILYVTSLDGRRLLAATISGSTSSPKLTAFRVALGAKYGRLRTVVAAPDGALWLTTSNKDGHGKPVADDERVIRILINGGGLTSPA